MKIALVIERMDPLRGGRETYTARIASALHRRGHEITILCMNSSWTCEAGIVQEQLGCRSTSRLGRMRGFVSDVQQRIAPGEYDIVHAMLSVPGANVYHPHGGVIRGSIDGSLRRRTGVMKAAARLGKAFNRCRRESAALERRIVEQGSALCLCVSEMVAEQFRRYYGPTGRTRVVFNGVEVPLPTTPQRPEWRRRRRAEIGADDSEMVLLTVATNFCLKGVRETIGALARRRGRGGRLVVVGREKVDRYRRIAEAAGVGEAVTFVGPTEDVFQWYAAADVFVLLTWYDPCSLTVLEAARWGIPSLTTRFNGAAEAFAGGGCVVVDSPRDCDSIDSALDDFGDPVTRAEHALVCRGLFDRLSLDRHVDELLNAYAEAVKLK